MFSACPLPLGMPPEDDDTRKADQDCQCEGRSERGEPAAGGTTCRVFPAAIPAVQRSAGPPTRSAVFSQSVGRGVAGGGLFLQALQDDCLEVAGNLWNQPSRRYGGVIADLLERVEDCRSLVWRASG